MSQSGVDWGLLTCRSWDQKVSLSWSGEGTDCSVWEGEVHLEDFSAVGQGAALVSRDVFIFTWNVQKHSNEQWKLMVYILAKKLAVLAASVSVFSAVKNTLRRITAAALTFYRLEQNVSSYG